MEPDCENALRASANQRPRLVRGLWLCACYRRKKTFQPISAINWRAPSTLIELPMLGIRYQGHFRSCYPVDAGTYTAVLRRNVPCKYWALAILATLPRCAASIRFLFVRPAFCLGLPSDSRSPATPLPLANTSPCRVCRAVNFKWIAVRRDRQLSPGVGVGLRKEKFGPISKVK
jgi:hypothetical protein